MGAGDADRRPGPRGQRAQRRRGRADRRGARPGAARRSPRAAGPTTSTSIFTTDHGELQGDFGLLFKGPYHVDGADAPAADLAAGAVGRGRAASVVTAPGRPGRPRPDVLRHRRRRRRRSGWRARRCPSTTPTPTTRGFERVLTEWDSELFGVGVHLRTIYRDGWVCTTYLPGLRARRHRGRAVRPGRRPAAAGQPVGRPGARGAARRPRRRPVGPPAPDDFAAAAGGGAGLRVGWAVARQRVGSLSARESAEDPSAGPVPARSRPRRR